MPDMFLSDYQDGCVQYAQWTNEPPFGLGGIPPLVYCALGLTGEAGEFANKVKKVYRDHQGNLPRPVVTDLIYELGDVLWYVGQAARTLGWSLDGVAKMNLYKLAERQAKGAVKGSGETVAERKGGSAFSPEEMKRIALRFNDIFWGKQNPSDVWTQRIQDALLQAIEEAKEEL